MSGGVLSCHPMGCIGDSMEFMESPVVHRQT